MGGFKLRKWLLRDLLGRTKGEEMSMKINRGVANLKMSDDPGLA